jgi:peptidoglycan/LPS O-acetylase OafA/YrhL
MEYKKSVALKKSDRFDALDALRGIAAIAVMIYHYTQHIGLHWLPGAWTSVDLFFILSGFVIYYRYQGKITQGLHFTQFLRLRILRLGPLYVMGLLLGIFAALLLLLKMDGSVGAHQVIVSSFLGLFVIPYFHNEIWPFGIDQIRGSIFPLNNPAWSLFFEIFVNIVFFFYILKFYRSDRLRLVKLSVAFWFFYLLISQQYNPGWCAENFIFGFPRVIGEFSLGILVFESYRKIPKIHPSLAFLILAVLLASFTVSSLRVAFISALILSPLVILLGAQLKVKDTLQNLCQHLGDISYPLYITHFPVYLLLYTIIDMSQLNPILQLMIVGSLAIMAAYLLSSVDRQLRSHLYKTMVSSPLKISS